MGNALKNTGCYSNILVWEELSLTNYHPKPTVLQQVTEVWERVRLCSQSSQTKGLLSKVEIENQCVFLPHLSTLTGFHFFSF